MNLKDKWTDDQLAPFKYVNVVTIDCLVLHFENLHIIIIVKIQLQIRVIGQSPHCRNPFGMGNAITCFRASRLRITRDTDSAILLVVTVCVILRAFFQAVRAVLVRFLRASGQAVVHVLKVASLTLAHDAVFLDSLLGTLGDAAANFILTLVFLHLEEAFILAEEALVRTRAGATAKTLAMAALHCSLSSRSIHELTSISTVVRIAVAIGDLASALQLRWQCWNKVRRVPAVPLASNVAFEAIVTGLRVLALFWVVSKASLVIPVFLLDHPCLWYKSPLLIKRCRYVSSLMICVQSMFSLTNGHSRVLLWNRTEPLVTSDNLGKETPRIFESFGKCG